MVPALVVFVLVAGLVVGVYAAAVRLPGALAGRRLDRRLQEIASGAADVEAAPAENTIVRRVAEGPLPGVDRLMARTRAGAWLGRLTLQAGSRTTPSAVIVGCLGCGVAAGVLAWLFTGQALAAPAAALLAACLPVLWLMHRRSVRLKRFEEQFPEALDLLARAIRAGHAFQTAMGMAAEEMDDPVGPEFKIAFDQQNFGLPLRDALNAMPERMPLLDVRFFVTAVLIQRDTGGNLSEILENLAAVVRDRFKIRRQIRVHTAHGRFTGYVLLALPACLAVALSMMNPEHMAPLFHERLGQMMLIGAMVMQTIGYFWIRKVIRIEV
ncbi:MAG: type II secretion system F family protein [Acidobacteria bacterium]|nr:type II secretion system F family protein [Acidobacteriota bacterium]